MIVTRQPPTKLELKVGDKLELLCEAAGPPPLVYTWFKDGTPMRPGPTGLLWIDPVDLKHAAVYTCEVLSRSSQRAATSNRVKVEVGTCTEEFHVLIGLCS